ALLVPIVWPMVVGLTLVGIDAATFFYPMYSFLGEQLRAGDVPGWNPYQFSGLPFAGDPQSGWMYLPVMLLFTVLPLSAAAKALLVAPLLLAALAAYALARALGIEPLGALTAGVAYGFSGYMQERNACCAVFTGVAAWLPVLILCSELAVRSRSRWARAAWLAGGAWALSQTLALWLGQGAYYTLLVWGVYLAYRVIISPPPRLKSPRARVTTLLVHGASVGVWAGALAAAGLLPRLEFARQSNLSGGYQSAAVEQSVGGLTLLEWLVTMLRPGTGYVGAVAFMTALVALPLVRRRHAAPCWAGLAVASAFLASPEPGLLHRVLYFVLPGFERLHPHHPERISQIFYLCTALLAGAATGPLVRHVRGSVLVLLGVGLLALMLLNVYGHSPLFSILLLSAAALLCVGLVLTGRKAIVSRQQAAGVALLLLLFLDLFAGGRVQLWRGLEATGYSVRQGEPLMRVDLDEYYRPSGAAAFLLGRTSERAERYFGYDPRIRVADVLYRYQFKDPRTGQLLGNNRATLLGLPEVQGYNPLHLTRYDEYMEALNGTAQEYRGSYVLPDGLASPLLDPVNARYLLVPNDPSRSDFMALRRSLPTAYEDNQVVVLERPSALPPAWIVHDVRRTQPGEALRMLSTGAVDPATTALLDGGTIAVQQPPSGTTDVAEVREYEPDRMLVRTTSAADGLLVLSEPYYPAWRAYVDGKPTELYRANHILRAVPVPAGSHEVELRYESWTLQVGLLLSLGAYLALAMVLVLTVRHVWLRRADEHGQEQHREL
ncbi:MAG: YfhO family protein, partial [Chloroflexota bacterium]|nr:YfhO family protein [Chloroflexota bacterium]